MTEYLALSIMPLLLYLPFKNGLSSDDKRTKNKNKIFYLILSGCLLFLFLALRSRHLGSTDTAGYYENMREAIHAKSFDAYFVDGLMEEGFQIFVYALSRIFDDPQSLVVVSSAIFVISLCIFVYKNSSDIPMSLVMYITLGMMSFEMQGMRQSIAMSICLLSYEFVKKRKVIPFALLIILAFQFHRTALIFVLIYLLSLLKYNAISGILVLIISAISIAFSNTIVRIGVSAFDKSYGTTGFQSGGYVALLIYFIIIIFAFLFNKKLKSDKAQSSLMFICIFGAIFFIMRYTGSTIAERISFYFVFSQLILLPATIDDLPKNERFPVRLAVYVLSILLFMYRLNGSDLIPYRTFWNVY